MLQKKKITNDHVWYVTKKKTTNDIYYCQKYPKILHFIQNFCIKKLIYEI